MDRHIIEITENKRHLCIKRGFMLVMHNELELARIPLDSIGVIIANSHGMTLSNNLLVALGEHNIPFVVCAKNHQPVNVLRPVSGNYRHSACTDAQIRKISANKRIWKEIVTNKIKCQRSVLESLNKADEQLKTLEKTVAAGDKTNNEAHAARIYWSKLFGKEFYRDRDADGVNALLNYGYTILRSLTSRAVMSVGLNPVLGIHHRNKLNPFRIADDIMEPFRPMVDQVVYELYLKGMLDINKDTKKSLATVHTLPVVSGGVSTTLGFAVHNLCSSIAKYYLEETERLIFPEGVVSKNAVSEFFDE